MAKLEITIDLDNAAFDPPGPGVARILERLAHDCRLYEIEDSNLRDLNGNLVGKCKVSN